MPLAGEIIRASDVNRRIATTVETTDGGTFTTTETVVLSVTAALVAGRTYKLTCIARLSTTVANDGALIRLREDSVSGTEMASQRLEPMSTNAAGNLYNVEVEYTASATANKTFVAAGIRSSGSGNLAREAGVNRPNYLYVDYVY